MKIVSCYFYRTRFEQLPECCDKQIDHLYTRNRIDDALGQEIASGKMNANTISVDQLLKEVYCIQFHSRTITSRLKICEREAVSIYFFLLCFFKI